jgi:hypothetical protein
MEILWMVTETILLILGGVLGLAVATHVTSRTRRR